ncbi:MAG: ABC transporter permease [bacterium]|nr:ABC transporter permease [bacterium]
MRMSLLPLIFKQATRNRVRSLLTISGIAIAMFLFTSIQAMQTGVNEATTASADDTKLVVYRKDRFCPATSQLPQDYQSRIERIEGVTSALPIKVVVTNCGTSLDVVTFRGVPKESFLEDREGKLEVLSGSTQEWMSRSDATLVGETLAKRRGLQVGKTFDAAGIRAYVAGIIRSEELQDGNTAFASLDFIQLAGRNQLGIVTQFDVTVSDSSQLEPVAEAIDEMFRTAQEPTMTATENTFIAQIASDMIELVGFARWLGIGCLIAVMALIGNAIVLSVQSRIAEHAILQTLGFRNWQIALLIVGEGALIATIGAVVGGAAAIAATKLTSFSLSVEGQSIPILAGPELLLTGLLVCASLGVVAGIIPAIQASRREITACFRAV